MKFKVKSWWYREEQSKANCYNWILVWREAYKDKDGHIRFYLMHKRCPYEVCGHVLSGNKLKETEKAIQVELDFWNFNKGQSFRDAPIEQRWKTWIPKSVLL